MKIHQLSVNYIGEQDRLLARINTTAHEEFRLWLTRRLMLNFWPLLNKTVLEHVAPTGLAQSAALADDLSRQALSEFQREQSLAKADFNTPYKTTVAALPMTAEPLLVSEIQVARLEQGQVSLNFVERLQDVERLYASNEAGRRAPRSFQMTLDPHLLHGLVHLLSQAQSRALWVAAVPSPDVASPDEGEADVASAPKPKYLN